MEKEEKGDSLNHRHDRRQAGGAQNGGEFSSADSAEMFLAKVIKIERLFRSMSSAGPKTCSGTIAGLICWISKSLRTVIQDMLITFAEDGTNI